MSRVTAAQHASVLLLGVAAGSLAIGVVSDRLRNRRALMRLYTLALCAVVAAVDRARAVAARWRRSAGSC